MTKQLKIALVGGARSGKDTVAGFIVTTNPNLRTYALADPIKEVVHALVGVTKEVAETQKDIDMAYTVSAESQERAVRVFDAISAKNPELLPEFFEFWEMFEGLVEVTFTGTKFYYQGTLRKLYQLFGTEFGRSRRPDSWTLLTPDNALVTDVRFVNEANILRSQGYTIVKIKRNMHTVSGRISSSAEQHASEIEINNIVADYAIINAADLNELSEKTQCLVNYLKTQ